MVPNLQPLFFPVSNYFAYLAFAVPLRSDLAVAKMEIIIHAGHDKLADPPGNINSTEINSRHSRFVCFGKALHWAINVQLILFFISK